MMDERMRDALTRFCYLTGRLTGPSEGPLLALRMSRVEAIERRLVEPRTIWDAPDVATVTALAAVANMRVNLSAAHWRQPAPPEVTP